jgi:deoxyribodipyrimidine photo-lyase
LLGSKLIFRSGPTAQVLQDLIKTCKVNKICWNRRYEPNLIECDRKLKSILRTSGLEVQTFNANLLFEPWTIGRDIKGSSPAPYRVFTAYWRACYKRGFPGIAHERPKKLPSCPREVASTPLQQLELLPQIPWDDGLKANWQPGEKGALSRLEQFLDNSLQDYPDRRDQPALPATSMLSPYLHFGEIGPRQISQAVHQREAMSRKGRSIEVFLRQVGWREFAHHLLFHFPLSDLRPLNERFAAFPWRHDYSDDLCAWQQGVTGIPLVDAGMRELWHTGWMHNRVRMVVASFLTKNLLIPWQEGAAWFWDTLVDADLANNSMGWQWVAGCGADAAPYFRVFNPVLQSEKFDPEGAYVLRWVPELNGLPIRYIHKPWSAPASVRLNLGDYPPPMVDLKTSRERALSAYRRV